MSGDGTAHGESTDAEPMDAPKRNRSSVRRSTAKRARTSVIGPAIASVLWEVLGELVFLLLVGLVSWLVYEELRWPFIVTVFLAVNAVLGLIALAVWTWRRRSRRRSRRPEGGRGPE